MSRMKIDVEKLKELAGWAELGKWIAENEGSSIVLQSGKLIADYIPNRVDADYILAVQPGVILALLDERDEMEAENKALMERWKAADAVVAAIWPTMIWFEEDGDYQQLIDALVAYSKLSGAL
jgi:hypothetical protein